MVSESQKQKNWQRLSGIEKTLIAIARKKIVVPHEKTAGYTHLTQLPLGTAGRRPGRSVQSEAATWLVAVRVIWGA